MITLFSIIMLGFFLGMKHATDADHVVAVTTFVTRERSVRSAALIGILWGIGHSISICVVGSAIIIFGIVVPEKLGMSLEFCVALMLIVLGLLNLQSFVSWVRSHALHRQAMAGGGHLAMGESPPENVEERMRRWVEWRIGSLGLPQILRPLAVGIVHGLAGSAAVALLVLPMIHNTWWACVYLLVFGLGTILGMMVITGAIAWPCSHFSDGSPRLRLTLTRLAGVLSLGFGLFLVYQIGFVDGLFTK
jgi:High-affinity nickel-transport protein